MARNKTNFKPMFQISPLIYIWPREFIHWAGISRREGAGGKVPAERCRRKGSGKKVPAIRFQPTNQTNPITTSTSTSTSIGGRRCGRLRGRFCGRALSPAQSAPDLSSTAADGSPSDASRVVVDASSAAAPPVRVAHAAQTAG